MRMNEDFVRKINQKYNKKFTRIYAESAGEFVAESKSFSAETLTHYYISYEDMIGEKN